MARGYPDYFGFSVFPSYGDFAREDFNENPGGGAVRYEIFGLTAKGKTAGGYFYVHTAPLTTNDFLLEVRIDGEYFSPGRVWADVNYNYSGNPDNILQLKYANTRTHVYTYAFAKDWTFGYEFDLVATVFDINDITCLGSFFYFQYA